jgi:hypothetical protein
VTNRLSYGAAYYSEVGPKVAKVSDYASRVKIKVFETVSLNLKLYLNSFFYAGKLVGKKVK